MAFGWDDLIVPAFSAAASFLGGERRNEAQAAQAASANAFSANQFATRYQTTVKDMEAAGLNPMLAYSQGGGSPPSGQQAQMSDTVSPAVSAGQSAGLISAQKEVLEAQAEQARAAAKASSAQAAKTAAETLWVDSLSDAQVTNLGASAENLAQLSAQSKETVSKIKAEVDKIVEETKGQSLENLNKVQAGEVLKASAKQLFSQFVLNMEKAKSEPVARQQMAASIRLMGAQGLNLKVLASKTGGVDTLRGEIEAALSRVELHGAEAFGQLGTDTKYLKPFLELLWNATRR